MGGLGAGGCGGLAGFEFFQAVFNFRFAAFALAVAGGHAEFAPERGQGEVPLLHGFHDGAAGDAPAQAHFLVVV